MVSVVVLLLMLIYWPNGVCIIRVVPEGRRHIFKIGASISVQSQFPISVRMWSFCEIN